eukprot:Gb_41769 [translate_table: standard]
MMLWKRIGISSNNVAEAKALHSGLRILTKRNIWRVRIYGDSRVIIKHVLNKWSCNNPTLMGVIKEIQIILQYFDNWEISHLERRWNVWADSLAKVRAEKEKGSSGYNEEPISIKDERLELKIRGGNGKKSAGKINITWDIGDSQRTNGLAFKLKR